MAGRIPTSSAIPVRQAPPAGGRMAGTGARVTAPSRRGGATCLLLLAAAGLLTGCATASAYAPPLRLRVSLDRPEYRIGEAVIATVELENTGRAPINVPRFDPGSVKFMTGEKAMTVRVHQEPVYSTQVRPEPRVLPPGGKVARPFGFTRVTREAGEFALLASFKGAERRGEVIEDTIYAEPVPFRVQGPVLLRRDPADGLILKEQAEELAKKAVPGELIRAVLARREESGLFAWLMFFRAKGPDGKETVSAVQVDPYTGRVRPFELDQAAAGKEAAPGEQKER